jgi:8-oxo-dGTP pyrophosphatase MutT (NUDIX family)
MKNFVCGLVFTTRIDYVCLIRKKRPPWMLNLLNGVGGEVESQDKVWLDAMVREFREETTQHLEHVLWKPFATTIIGTKSSCHWFTCRADFDLPDKSPTDEQVCWFPLSRLPLEECVSDMRWLIPMAQGWKGGEPYGISRNLPEMP